MEDTTDTATRSLSLAGGVDLGGNNIRAGFADTSGSVVWKRSLATPTSRSPDDVADAIAGLLRAGLDELTGAPTDVVGATVGVTGPVRRIDGVARLSPNFGWRDVPFGELLSRRLPDGLRIFLENDVRLVTFGEWQYGAGRGVADLICVTLGTGVGSALVLRDEPFAGADESAGEIGHIVIDQGGRPCGCGNRGCLEQYASATAVERDAEARGLRGPGGRRATAEDVAVLAARGYPVAEEILARAARAVAIALAAAVNLLNPARVVVGGGLARAGDPLWTPLREETVMRVMPPLRERLVIVPAELGDDAGILGGAWSTRRSVRSSGGSRR